MTRLPRFRASSRRSAGVVRGTALLLFAASCDTGNVTRDCSAFDNTRVGDWQSLDAIGESSSFVDDDGNTVVMVLTNRVDSEAFMASGTGSDGDDLDCVSRSERRFNLDDSAVGLVVGFEQTEAFANQPPAEQELNVTLRPQDAAGTLLPYDYFIVLTNAVAFYGDETVSQTQPPIITRATRPNGIGGDRAVRIEQEYSDADFVQNLSPTVETAISRIVLLEGEGLVSFDRADGTRFVREDLAGGGGVLR